MIYAGLGIAGLAFGLSVLGLNFLPWTVVAALVVGGAVFVTAYVRHARRTPNPVLDLTLFRIPTFRASIIGGFIFRLGIGALPFLLPLMLQIGFGKTPFASGLITFGSAAGAIGMKVAASTLLKRFGFRTILMINAIISACFWRPVPTFTQTTPAMAMFLLLVVGGFFRSLQFTSVNTIAYADVEQSRVSRATALASVGQQLSISSGVALGALAVDITARLQRPRDVDRQRLRSGLSGCRGDFGAVGDRICPPSGRCRRGNVRARPCLSAFARTSLFSDDLIQILSINHVASLVNESGPIAWTSHWIGAYFQHSRWLIRKAFFMRATRPENKRLGPLLAAMILATAMPLALALVMSLALPLTVWPTEASAQAHYFRDPNAGYPIETRTRRPSPNTSRTPRQSMTLPSNGEPVAIEVAQPTVPRPPGSNARVCANQTEDAASYRIDACTAIISSGRLKGEALGVAYALRGLAHLDRSDIPHAIGDLNHAIDLAPDFAPAYQNRGNAWFARGNYGQALADYDKTIELDPNSPSPYVNRAALRRDLGFAEGAFADYAKAISLKPNHAAAYSGRGQLYLRQKNYARATADFDKAVRLAPTAANYMLRARSHEAAGEFDAALRDYSQAARLEPKNVVPLNAMAVVFNKKRDYDKEIAVLNRAVTLDKNPSLSYRLRAEAYRDKGDRKRAYADIGRALKFSWTVNGLRVRGNLRLEDGDLAGALHDAEAILKIEDDNADAIALRGMTYAAKKDYARALPDLDKAIAADGDNAAAYATRGQIYAAKKDDARALADLNRAIELHIATSAPYRTRAAIYTAKGDSDKAIADLDQAITRDPKPAEPYFARAALRKAKGDSNGMLADLNDGLTRQPDNLAALNARADALMQAKDYAKAIEDFNRIVKLEPRDARVYYRRGQAYEQTQQRDQAIADYQAALKRDRKMVDARKALASTMAQAKAEARAKAKAEAEAQAQAKAEAVKKARLASRNVKLDAPDANAGAPATVEPAQPEETVDANGNTRTVPLPAVRPEIAALNAPGATPDATASIPADAGRTVTRQSRQVRQGQQVRPDREPAPEQARKPIQKRRETARERAKRDYLARKREYLARKQARERAAYLARERLRHMSPSEQRRLYFENLDRQRRARSRREANFTDIWR